MLTDYLNKITCINCLKALDNIPDDSIDAVVIDPPYGEGFEYDGDETLKSAKSLLKAFLKKVKSKLKQNSHIVIFWTMRNVDVCIESTKEHFTFRRVATMYLPKGGARPYLGWLPRTQAIVIGQKYVPGQPSDFHYELSEHLKNKLDESLYNRSSLAKALGCDSRLVMKWTRPGDPSWCLPTPRFYPKLKELLNLDNRFDFLLTRENTTKRKECDFSYKHDCYIIDDKNEYMIHPAQKPLSVVEHIVTCVCPKGGIVLDGFSGSGTTAVAARNTKRNFICFEISEDFCKIARERLK